MCIDNNKELVVFVSIICHIIQSYNWWNTTWPPPEPTKIYIQNSPSNSIFLCKIHQPIIVFIII